MLKRIAIIVVSLLIVGIVAVLALAATKPDNFRVQRTINIEAPPETVFALIDDLDTWVAWSPYERKDPEMTRHRSGADAGVGSVYAWDGDKNVGQGRMEITESSPPSRVTIKLDFVRPLEAHNTVVFTLEPEGDSTNVTWAMDGPAPFVSKVMQVFFDMDAMVGQDFQAGLANLKVLAEG